MRLTTFLSTLSLLSLVAADAGTILNGDKNNEGEGHGDLKPPDGSRLKQLPIGDSGSEVTLYWSEPLEGQRDEAKSVYVMVHGKLRDGDHYWGIMKDALDDAIKDKVPGADEKAYLIAPQFFSEEYNSGQFDKNTLAFGDTNGWQAGDVATHPAGTVLTSMDALDAILDEFKNKDLYPSITNVTFVGHGGGGQLVTRYAAVGQGAPDGIYVRYIVGDASTHAYFTEQRPSGNFDDSKGCDYWNTWRYGFDNFTGTAHGKKDPVEYFEQYINRDIIILIAKDDTSAGGDQFCPAQMQGGPKRRDRNLAWWTYINTLARTKEPVQLFGVANFSDVPDWSQYAQDNTIIPRLIVIEDADHDPEVVFGSSGGRAALFNQYTVPGGWRPSNYDSTESDCSGCASKDGEDDGGNNSQGDSPDDGGDDGGDHSIRVLAPVALITLLSSFTVLAL